MTVIYGLVCPISGGIRYVGKTKVDLDVRLRAHISKARSGSTRHHCAHWIRKLDSRGLSPSIVSLFEVPDGEDWRFHESRIIREQRESGASLTNATCGGDGFHNVEPWVIQKRVKSRRKTMSDPAVSERHRAALSDANRRPEVKRKRSESAKSIWNDEATRNRMIEGMRSDSGVRNRAAATRARFSKPDERKKQSERMAERARTPEGVAILKKATKAAADSEIRKAALRAALRTPEYREKMRGIGAEIASRPEVKAAKSEKSRAMWRDRSARERILASFASDDCKRKQSESKIAAWSDPIVGAKLRAIHSSEEVRKKKSEAARRRATPEYRAMMAERTRLSWEKRRARQGA